MAAVVGEESADNSIIVIGTSESHAHEAGVKCRFWNADSPPWPRFDQHADVSAKLAACFEGIETLQRRFDAMTAKLEEYDSVHRGQLDCVSERIYDCEKNLRQAENRQDEAIEKASATFQKQSANLMHVINQVNTNFNKLSEQIAEQRVTMSASDQTLTHLQAALTASAADVRSNARSNDALASEMATLGVVVQGLDSSVRSHGEQLCEIQREQPIDKDRRYIDTCLEEMRGGISAMQADIWRHLDERQGYVTKLLATMQADAKRQLAENLETARSMIISVQAPECASLDSLRQAPRAGIRGLIPEVSAVPAPVIGNSQPKNQHWCL